MRKTIPSLGMILSMEDKSTKKYYKRRRLTSKDKALADKKSKPDGL